MVTGHASEAAFICLSFSYLVDTGSNERLTRFVSTQVDLHEANKKLQAGAAKAGIDTTQERRQLEEQKRQLEEQRRQTEERAKSVDQKARTIEEKERTLQSLDQDLKKRKAKMDQLEQQLQRVKKSINNRDNWKEDRTISLVLFFCFIERWLAGQEIGGNAEGSGNCREGIGKGERGIDQKLCRDRKVAAADADDPGRAECQRKTNQRTSRVSIVKVIQIILSNAEQTSLIFHLILSSSALKAAQAKLKQAATAQQQEVSMYKIIFITPPQKILRTRLNQSFFSFLFVLKVICKFEIFYIYNIYIWFPCNDRNRISKLASMEKRLTNCLSQFSRWPPPLDTTRTRTIFVFACFITIVCFFSMFVRPIVSQLQLYIYT